MKKTALTIRRRIYFYRLSEAETSLPILANDLSRIANLPFTEEGRYLNDGDFGRLCVWPDDLDHPIKLRFGRTRLTDLPTKEIRGKLESLPMEGDAGLAELIHVVIFGDGYIGAEFNFDAPRLRHLATYFFKKRNEASARFSFLPLFQKDVVGLVENLSEITLLELSGTPETTHLIKEADADVGSAYNTLIDSGSTSSTKLVLRASKKENTRLKTLAGRFANLAHQRPWDVSARFRKLKISGITSKGAIDEVDLLSDHLMTTKIVDKISKKNKALHSPSVYQQIISAYNELRDEFPSATVGRMFADDPALQ